MGISKLDIVVSAISLVLAALNIFAAIWVRLDILSHIFVFWLLMLGSVGALALALNSFVPNRTLSAFQARESLHSKHGRDAEPSNLMIGYTKFSNWLTLIINIVALAILGAIFSSSLF
ncbi:MAG: hypothetical protein LBS74_03265 [Oscillospiraceae bacterium]|jgi:hypothetical protein|nr:hypothetical protein [Oscillospiraceae bacterium]